MRILFLSQVLPYPLDAGPKTRAYYTLRYLAREHEITLVSFVRATDTEAAVRHLRQYCSLVVAVPMFRRKTQDASQLLLSLVKRQPFIILRDQVRSMTATLGRLLLETGFDAVHADQLWMASYALAAQSSRRFRRPSLVLDQHNAVFRIPERLAAAEVNPLKRALLRLEARKLARYEVETCPRFDRVVWVTSEDHAAVQGVAGNCLPPIPRSAVIPICGDSDETHPVSREAHPRRVVFVSGLNYPPNAQAALWFAEQVFPQVLRQVPGASFTVIGKDPPRDRLAAAIPPAALDVTGYVEDLRPYLQESAVFVVPLLAGGGMRVKIIDAWMWGIPIVTTSIGIEGIEHRPGVNVIVADGVDTFVRATVDLLKDPVRQDQLITAGLAWAKERYDWRTRYQAWSDVYAGLKPRA